MKNNKYITIIIPTHNSEKTLIYTLWSLKSLKYNKKLIKIVIVDDNSIDETRDIILKFKYKYEKMFHSIDAVFLDKAVTVSKARNIGIKRSLPNSYIFLLDSDVILEPYTINNLIAVLESDPSIGAIGALYLTNKPSFFEKVMWYRYLGKKAEGPAGTGALLIRPDVIEKVGLFNERLGYPRTLYEDLEYVMRIRKAGYKVIINGDEILCHVKHKFINSHSKYKFDVRNILVHLFSYTRISKAFALYNVLKVAPIRYKIEYLIYTMIPLILLVSLLYDSLLAGLSVLIIAVASSLYSVIVYNSLDMKLRVVAGPSILVSRILRAISLVLYIICKNFKRCKLSE